MGQSTAGMANKKKLNNTRAYRYIYFWSVITLFCSQKKLKGARDVLDNWQKHSWKGVT